MKNFTGVNYYEVLGVLPTATDEEIKKAFREMAKEYHPDISGRKNTDVFTRQIYMAYETLTKFRTEYDAVLMGVEKSVTSGETIKRQEEELQKRRREIELRENAIRERERELVYEEARQEEMRKVQMRMEKERQENEKREREQKIPVKTIEPFHTKYKPNESIERAIEYLGKRIAEDKEHEAERKEFYKWRSKMAEEALYPNGSLVPKFSLANLMKRQRILNMEPDF